MNKHGRGLHSRGKPVAKRKSTTHHASSQSFSSSSLSSLQTTTIPRRGATSSGASFQQVSASFSSRQTHSGRTISHRSRGIATRKSLSTTSSSSAQPPSIITKQRFSAAPPRERKKVLTGDFFDVPNKELPLATYPNDSLPIISIDQQLQNPYHRNVKDFKVPGLYWTNKEREQASKRALASPNKTLAALRKHIAEAESRGGKFYLVDLPNTPAMSQAYDRLYETDPPSYSFPPNKYLDDSPGAPLAKTWGTLALAKQDILDLERKLEYDKNFQLYLTKASRDSVSHDQVRRNFDFITNRCKNPALYTTFGLDPDHYLNRIHMLIIHTWFFMRSMQSRPTHNAVEYRNTMMKVYDYAVRDSLRYDFNWTKASARDHFLSFLLPGTRTAMIGLDKALVALAGGYPDPMYSALYRLLYRPSEPHRYHADFKDFDPQGLRGRKYIADLEVYMDNPIDFGHMNNLVNYMVNQLNSLHNSSPRDYYLQLHGWTDMIDIPKPAASMGGLTKEEMERFCYPIFNLNNPRPNTIFGRLANTISPPKMKAENWFLNPVIDGPAHRPPQYMLTAGGYRH